jgi:hypothetical protein
MACPSLAFHEESSLIDVVCRPELLAGRLVLAVGLEEVFMFSFFYFNFNIKLFIIYNLNN